MSSLCSLPVLLALATLPTLAQTPAQGVRPGRALAAPLRPYVGCQLPGGPDNVERTPLPQAPMSRAAQTFAGPKKIQLVDGVFQAFAYPGAATFANVKTELLPAATYATEKADLISEFDKINATGEDTQRNYALKPTLNGFEIYGFDRRALDGNVLGIYLMFDNPHRVATTAYFLNAQPGQRKFSTVAEYTALREGFLSGYTSCVRKALAGAAPARSTAVKSVKRRH